MIMKPTLRQFNNLHQRIPSIDIMRGFAIFGIFLVNMMSFHSPYLYIDPLYWWEGKLDQLTFALIDVFAQGSFYPLFSILFGFSFVLFRESLLNKGISFPGAASRRVSFLLCTGIVHAFFVWHGDILYQYGIMAIFFLLFLSLSGRTLLYSGVSIYLLSSLLLTVWIIVIKFMFQSGEIDFFNQQAAEQSYQVYRHGTFLQITEQRIEDWLITNNLMQFPFLFLSIFPLFLIGAGVAKLRWLENPERHRKKLSRILVTSFCLGLGLKLAPYLFYREALTLYLQDSVGGVCMAIAYGLFIVKLPFQKWLIPLASVGRMSISNYLFQSVASTLIFYHYGLGMYGRVSLFNGTILAIVIFGIQVFFSYYWLKRYPFGPIEWIWRSFVYLKSIKGDKAGAN